MSTAYTLAYRLGITPWEDAAAAADASFGARRREADVCHLRKRPPNEAASNLTKTQLNATPQTPSR